MYKQISVILFENDDTIFKKILCTGIDMENCDYIITFVMF